MSRLPLRIRVALAFAATSALVLVGLGFFVYLRVESTLDQQTRASLLTRMEALVQTPESARRETVEAMNGEAFAQVVTAGVTLGASSPQIGPDLLGPTKLPEPGRSVTYERRVSFVDEGESENATLQAERLDGDVLVVGTSREGIEDALHQLRTQLLVAIPIALGIAVAIGYWVAGRALEPVRSMTRRAATISAENPTERLPLPGAKDEITDLGLTLNAMLDRLDDALQRERRFIAEASHDLRTPLALLRVELDLALSRTRSADELSAALRSTSEEVDRLMQLAEGLLDFSAATEPRRPVNRVVVDLASLLDEVQSRFAGEASLMARQITLTVDGPVYCLGDRGELLRVFGNLVDNALRHGAGPVAVAAARASAQVTITVVDGGPGSPVDVAGEEFDPFARSGSARASATRGLGLAIVRAVVDRHGGQVSLAHRPDPPSTIATVVLPAEEVARVDS